MATSTILLICALIAFAIWSIKDGGRLPKAFRQRSCQGAAWMGAFPGAKKDEIRRFLSLFVSAFAFNDDQKLRLTPDDKILEIYRALYPSRWLADALEVETLAEELERQYGLSLQTIWHEHLTLGQLFSHIHARGLRAEVHL